MWGNQEVLLAMKGRSADGRAMLELHMPTSRLPDSWVLEAQRETFESLACIVIYRGAKRRWKRLIQPV